MSRPITLFTGQWADLPFEEVAKLAAEWGYDGLEIACSGDHLDVARGAVDDHYIANRREILDRHGLQVFAISAHLQGQAVCDDPIDQRHRGILNSTVWGDGDPEGVRQRAAEAVKNAARTAARLGVSTVVGFTGSSIWKYIAMFPPASGEMIDAGYQDFADRWNPILDVFDEVGVRFAHEVHPSEIAYDYYSTQRALEAIGHRKAFGINWDPSHMVWQNIDPVQFIWDFRDRIYHVDCKDTKVRPRDGRRGVLGSHLPVGRPTAWVGLRVHRPRRCRLGRLLPDAHHHRVRRAHQHRMGRRRDGPPARCARGAGLHTLPAFRPTGHRLRQPPSRTRTERPPSPPPAFGEPAGG